MTQSGGSAAINGFLYQILHHIDWLSDVRLLSKLDGQEVKDACLILEPRSGGDSQAKTSSMYLVEQYKTRAHNTWSLNDVTKVLRDLRKAVPDLRPKNAHYRFVTNGRPGNLKAFEDFIVRLGAVESPDKLDDEKKRKFNNTIYHSDQEFLNYLVMAIRSNDRDSTPAEELEIVLHLLRCFEMKFNVRSDELVRDIEARLRPFACNLGDEINVRKQLIGELMGRLSKGENKFDKDGIDHLLRNAGLRPNRLRKVNGLSRKLREVMRRRSAYLRYRRESDVRAVPCWPEKKPVLLIAGESGVGKSWQLARLIEENAEQGELVVFVSGADTIESMLTRGAREIWQVGLGETSDKTLQAISNFFREDAFQLQPPFYTIVVDDVQSVDIARSLVRQDWTSLGARLILTAPPALARTLASSDGAAIHIHNVNEFSIDELDALFKTYGHRWAELPEDLKRLLRKPVLAGIFLELSVSSFQDAPQSEYEIFQAFWDRIEEKCNDGDKGIVAALAAHALETKLYPFPRKHWENIGLNNQNLASLEAAGWLNHLEHGEVVFAHDRLLNWAAAQFLYRQFKQGALSVDELFNCMTGEEEGGRTDFLVRFGYVPMDTLWLLSTEGNHNAELGQLVERMENHHAFGTEGRYLFTKLLPTLGQHAIPILLQRLDTNISNSAGSFRVGLIGDAFATLAPRKSLDIQFAIDSLLQSPSWDRQSVAVKVLEKAPDPSCLDRLWEIHQERRYAREHSADRRFERGHEATFSALRAGVALHPKWLRERICKADAAKEPVSELGYLLSGLDEQQAGSIWRDVRDVLMEKIEKINPRSLLHCIARFADHEQIDFVFEQLSSREEIVSATAMLVLAYLDPKEAISRISVKDNGQSFFRDDWLPILLRTDSELTRKRIRELAISDSRWQRLMEEYFEKRPADLDEETFDFVLRTREKQLRDQFDLVTTEDVIWPYYPLRFFGRMCCVEILRRLQNEAGGRLEATIMKLTCSRLRSNNRAQDQILEAGRRALVLFAGAGILTLINRELESEHFWVRHGGLNWAWVCGDEITIERLSAIARRPIPRDSAGEPESEARQEFHAAMIGLAALGADDVLIEVLSNPESVDAPLPLADFRAHFGPMSKSLTDQAVHAMRSLETSEKVLRCSLVIAWLSKDSDLVPVVRDVLDRVEPESQNARYACIALEALGDMSLEFARMAERVAFTHENCLWGLEALVGLGDEGVEGLRRWLKQQIEREHINYREFIIRALYVKTETQNDAIEAAVEYCRKHPISLRPLYEIAAESDNESIRERILEEAFVERSVMVKAPLDAIRGLAKFDTSRAEEAVVLGLSNHPKIERELCRLLVNIAPETAAEKLIEAAIALERDTLADAVGRALRRADSKAVIDAVKKHLEGPDRVRKVICQILEWLQIPELTQSLEEIAERASAISVRRAALDALYRHREEIAIRGLFSEFQEESCDARRWSFFFAILETADPYLLTDCEDSLWLGQIISKDVPYAYEHYAREVLEKRRRNE
ncbi:MAG: hypothetical protein OXE44_01865 [Nitrospinae bacterium]|nr:hypothetical protein [Nitrospinota bacterium]